ncbi:23S rRNA (pseudouridine(1915)-N(3))-methyltransferase RlmH [Prochlorococcus marinus]|uniref:23S rRNA (pseudouridine(1915)-N(3))-methyltransferase RlmH n=1 Tax=Prochlorococcus marinus TaxID=1219 RepID=UPI0022B5B9CB|nr:23S rRNA (pseudouridine(1915)-N(3))-methyltransferase RlmH [Prochlorococcus marinus]
MFNPSRYRIIAVGKIRKSWIQTALNLYIKRLPGLLITEIKDSNINKEAQAIRSSLKQDELLIALSEEGESLTSIAFSNRLQKLGSQRIAFIIGGPDGLSPDIKSLAHYCFSISPMTFPHEIARFLLLEQIYRATTIANRGPYHRE